VILLLVISFLFFAPIIFSGTTYQTGGDDSKMYYLYPLEFIKNFSFGVISGNNLGAYSGYNSVSFYFPILLIIYVVKLILPFWNTQMVMYGFIYSVGFLFFYLFLDLWDYKKNIFIFFSKIICSVFYVYSLFLIKSLYSSQLLSIFLVLATPGFLYFFTRGILKKDIRYILLSSLCYAVISSTVWTIPWFFPVLFTLIPYFIFLFWKEKRFFVRASIWFIVSTLFFNFYWIVHQIIHFFVNTGECTIVDYLTSKSLVQQNIDTITALVRLNDPVNQMSSYIRTSWKEIHGITLFQSLGILYLTVILFAGACIKKTNKELKFLFLVAIMGLIIGMMFITPNFGSWNLNLFLLSNQHVPFFTMFRNMYDKFGLAMAYMYAFCLFVSLQVIDEIVKPKIKLLFLVLILSLTIWRANTFVFPQSNEVGFSMNISGTLNTQFIDLVKYIKDMPTTSRYIWYPMTMPNYIYIRDRNLQNHYYYGVSILQPLADKADVAGYYGFSTSQEPNLKDKILSLLNAKQYDQLGEIWKKMNIGYVIVNKEPISGVGYAHLNEFNFVALQTDEYLHTILGDKIRDFGIAYSLYRINNTYQGETIELIQNLNSQNSQRETVHFSSPTSGIYDVSVRNLLDSKKLLLREPYNKLWKIYLVGNNNEIDLNLSNKPADTYGNVWNIDRESIIKKYASYISRNPDGSINLNLRIVFIPINATKVGLVISILSTAIAVLYIGFTTVKGLKGKRHE
jgi:hypothetical protein